MISYIASLFCTGLVDCPIGLLFVRDCVSKGGIVLACGYIEVIEGSGIRETEPPTEDAL